MWWPQLERDQHEDPGPSPSLVASSSEVGTANPDLYCAHPATGKENGRAMVFRRDRARRVLLRTSGDLAPGGRRLHESGNLLPRRSNHGAAERLEGPGDLHPPF